MPSLTHWQTISIRWRGAAIQDGKIRSLKDPVTQYIPQLAGSAYEGVTLRQLLTMSSGVRWQEDYREPDADVARYTTAIQEPGANPIVSYMRSLPRAKTGTTFNYNSVASGRLASVTVIGRPESPVSGAAPRRQTGTYSIPRALSVFKRTK